MSDRMGKSELRDLEPTVIDLDEVKGGMFLPARFPFRSSMTNTGEGSELASQFFTVDNVELL